LFTTPSAQILVVDDDDAIRELLSTVLDGAGYAVTVAPDGPTALQIAVAQFPDLVLTDVGLPGINGPALGAFLRGRGFAGPIILMTADDRRAAARPMQVTPVVRKPFDVNALLELITQELEGVDRGDA
jgi:CheY-like chemotaxis protein